jgi:hypothetical protein
VNSEKKHLFSFRYEKDVDIYYEEKIKDFRGCERNKKTKISNMEANFCNTVSPFLIQAVKDQTVPPDHNGDKQRPQSQCVVGLEMSRKILQLYFNQFSNRKSNRTGMQLTSVVDPNPLRSEIFSCWDMDQKKIFF